MPAIRPTMRRFVALVAIGVLVAGCSGAAPSATPRPTATAALPSPSAPPAATTAPAASLPAASGSAAAIDCAAITAAELKLAHGVTEQESRGQQANLFAKRVAELTCDKVKVQVFHNNTLGNDTEVLENLQTGTVDFSINPVWTNAIPAGAVFDLPYAFKDYEHWKRVVYGKPGDLVKASAAGKNLVILGYELGGWRDVYSTKRIDTMEDLKGLKLRTIQLPAYVQLFEALGAIPTAMAFPEVYLAIQQGTVDGAETALPAMYNAKHHEVAKFAAVTHHGLSTSTFLVSQATWDKSSDALKAAFRQAEAESTVVQQETVLKALDDVVGTLEAAGVTITRPDTAAAATLARDQVWPKIITDATLQEIADAIVALTDG